jgi:phosphoribosylanthranilate isomerase
MNRVRVKICGIRSLEEAEVAIEAGADALGFNFWPRSARYIDPKLAREISASLPAFIATVGVFVNEPTDSIKELALSSGLSAVQLHGDETPDDCKALSGLKVIKALRVDDKFSPESVIQYGANAILLDAAVRGEYGGTGRSFDWSAAVNTRKHAKVILAGGLTIENVGQAIDQVRPFAIDVCSGVESEPGKKDLLKIQEFMSSVNEANAHLQKESR